MISPSPSPFDSAVWIASPVVGGQRTSAAVPYVRKSFRLDQPVRSAHLTITALGLYECEINGTRIGDEVFAPGWTEYRKRVQYQTYDVSAQLQVGENAIGAILGDGWYCGYVAWCGRQLYGDRPRLLARIEAILEDGSTAVVVTDTTWKTSVGPLLESDLLMGESYDARLELGDWSKSNYDDSQWTSVLLSPPEHPLALVPRVGPPVRRIEEITPVGYRKLDGHRTHIFDLGQNITGRARLKIRSSRGVNVQIRFAEVLSPDGRLYTENLRAARCTDNYTCRGNGSETWEPRFTFHGFRHIEVQGNFGPDDQIEVAGVVLHSDTPPTGTFRCSHAGLNQLQHNIVWGQKGNFLEVPTDCPQRDERLGWTGDAQVFVRTASFNMDVREFFRKWMQDMRDSQRETGGIPCVIPAPWDSDPAGQDGGPAWADAEIICPWTIYLCYGDREILAEHYDSMKRFMTFMADHRCRGHIRNHPDAVVWQGFGDWLALDGSGRNEGITPFDLIGTAFYAHDAGLMAKIADLLGHSGDAEKYRALRGEIIKAFQRRFVTPEGFVASGTQTAYVLALHFGLLEESTRSTAARELVRHVEGRNYHLATGFVGTPYILDVLESAGYIEVAYKLLEQETFPSWLFPVRNGATTIWERWDGWTLEKGFQDKGMNSFNHYAYGAVGDWMYHTVAGLELDPLDPGYAHILFRPRPGGTITWAEATLETRFGLAEIRWEMTDGKLEVKLTVPSGARATFQPPPGYSTAASTFGEGRHRLVLEMQ